MVSLICLGPSFQKMTHYFLLHGSLWPTNLEKNLKPCSFVEDNLPPEEFVIAAPSEEATLVTADGL